MKRQPGFYWVFSYGIWHVAEWHRDRWMICGSEVDHYDKDFEKINERMIKVTDYERSN